MALEKFLGMYRKKKTVRNYRWTLKRFLTFLYDGEDTLKNLADRFLKEYDQDAIKEAIIKYFGHIKDVPGMTINLLLTGINQFLIVNNVELPLSFWKFIRNKFKRQPVSVDKIPTREQLRDIIEQLPFRGRCFYLILVSSGMRMGELLNLELDDVDIGKDPVEINIRESKSGKARVTFCSSEAKRFLTGWISNYRMKYLEKRIRYVRRGAKTLNDPRVFPFDYTSIKNLWYGGLKKSGHTKKSKGYYVFHAHTLRKFFISGMSEVIPESIVNKLVGHETGLSRVYRKYDVKSLSQYYKKGEGQVLIFSRAYKVPEIPEEVLKENIKLKQRLGQLEGIILKQDQKIEKIMKKLESLEPSS